MVKKEVKTISPLELYVKHVNELINLFEERKIPEVKQLCSMNTQNEHKIIGDEVIIPLLDTMSAILSIALGDKLLTNDMITELINYMSKKIRELLKKHFPKYWKGLLEHYLKHSEKIRNHYLAKIYTQALKEKK